MLYGEKKYNDMFSIAKYVNYFLLGGECKDEFPSDFCLILKQLGSCSQDQAKSICKKTCEDCEDDEEETTTETVSTTATPGNKILNAYVI